MSNYNVVTDRPDDDSHEKHGEDEAYGSNIADDDQEEKGKKGSYRQTHKPWVRSDEGRLLLYKDRTAMDWKGIFKCFLVRPLGTLRMRWHILQGR